MKRHWNYLKYVLRHKWYVFVECLRYGLIWRGIKHDWTKFLPVEWFPYARTFYALDGTSQDKPDVDFDRAWNHHQKANSHHWQYWLLSPDKPRPGCICDWQLNAKSPESTDDIRMVVKCGNTVMEWTTDDIDAAVTVERDLDNTPIPLQMPDADMKEMLADWRGVGRALGKPNTWEWYNANKHNIFLHPANRLWIETELEKQRRYHEHFEKAKRMGII